MTADPEMQAKTVPRSRGKIMADGDADYTPQLARNLIEILQSDRFVLEAFKKRDLKVSQALCLLWQDQTTGDVPGRKSSAPLYGSVTAAVLVDLIVLGKLNIEDAQGSCMSFKYKKVVIEIIDFKPTESYLDDCMFNQMLEHSHKHPGKPKSVEEWILKGSNYHKPSCASATFDSLVKLGLVGKKPKLWGTCMKFPTLNSGPQNELVKEIQMIALAGHATDGFTWTLLKLARFADSLFYGGAPILKHHFRKEEYDDAKKKIKELVDTKKQDTKGISGKEDKDLEFDNLCEIETCS